MPHDPALLAEVRGWLRKAGKDLATAEYELRADPPFADDVVFHAQQAAEKSVKAFLSWHRVPFRKTHNLVELGEPSCQIDQKPRDFASPGRAANGVRVEIPLSGRSRGAVCRGGRRRVGHGSRGL